MRSPTSDAALFFKIVVFDLVGLCASYVENTRHTGNEEYDDLTKETEKLFSVKILKNRVI